MHIFSLGPANGTEFWIQSRDKTTRLVSQINRCSREPGSSRELLKSVSVVTFSLSLVTSWRWLFVFLWKRNHLSLLPLLREFPSIRVLKKDLTNTSIHRWKENTNVRFVFWGFENPCKQAAAIDSVEAALYVP